MSNIEIETTEYEPEDFIPNQDHLHCYSETFRTARGYAAKDAGDKAVAMSILALAAQMARIADAIEFAVKETV